MLLLLDIHVVYIYYCLQYPNVSTTPSTPRGTASTTVQNVSFTQPPAQVVKLQAPPFQLGHRTVAAPPPVSRPPPYGSPPSQQLQVQIHQAESHRPSP